MRKRLVAILGILERKKKLESKLRRISFAGKAQSAKMAKDIHDDPFTSITYLLDQLAA